MPVVSVVRVTEFAWMVATPAFEMRTSLLMETKVGTPEPLATRNWAEVPAAVAWMAPAPLP